LNGRAAKSWPPTIARTSPDALSIATSEACGPLASGSHVLMACSAACWSRTSSVVRIFSPPSKALRAP
jgi:hypothetical protein